MRWPWQRRGGEADASPDPARDTNGERTNPTIQDLGDGLRLVVSAGEFQTSRGTFPSMVMSSLGLRDLGQKEILFAFEVRGDSEARELAPDVQNIFRMIQAEARRGNSVDVGGRTEFTIDGGYLARGNYGGILYTYPQFLPEHRSAGDSHLGGVFVHPEELHVAMECGPTRVLARLGQHYRYYPYPPFTERKRPSVIDTSVLEKSLLARVPRLLCPDSCGWIQGETAGPSIPGTSRPFPLLEEGLDLVLGDRTRNRMNPFLDEVPVESAFALLLTVDPKMGRCLVYTEPPGTPNSIHHHAMNENRCAGNHVVFGLGADENRIGTVEDGFWVSLDEDRAATLVAALRRGTPCDFPPEGSFSGFRLRWR